MKARDERFARFFRLLGSLILGVLMALLSAVFTVPAFADQQTPLTLDQASIGGAAFAGSAGIIDVNQAAGTGNEQVNVVTIQLHGASDAALATAVTQSAPLARRDGSSSQATATISPSAFSGASGLAQVNQTAGNGNATVNTFSLRVGP